MPSPTDLPSGCRFHTRCPHARERCSQEHPPLEDVGDGRFVACHFWREIAAIVDVGTAAVEEDDSALERRLEVYRSFQARHDAEHFNSNDQGVRK